MSTSSIAPLFLKFSGVNSEEQTPLSLREDPGANNLVSNLPIRNARSARRLLSREAGLAGAPDPKRMRCRPAIVDPCSFRLVRARSCDPGNDRNRTRDNRDKRQSCGMTLKRDATPSFNTRGLRNPGGIGRDGGLFRNIL